VDLRRLCDRTVWHARLAPVAVLWDKLVPRLKCSVGEGGVNSEDKPTQVVHDVLEGELVVRKDVEEGVELSSYEDDWLDSKVTKVVYIHNISSSIKSFIDSVDMLDISLPNNVFTLRRCLPTDRVFHGRGSSPIDFFFMYSEVFRDFCIRLPLDKFSIGVLRALNVAPTQLHPNS